MKLAEAKKWGMNFYLFGGLAIYRVASNNNIQKPTFNRQCLVISLMSPPFLYETC